MFIHVGFSCMHLRFRLQWSSSTDQRVFIHFVSKQLETLSKGLNISQVSYCNRLRSWSSVSSGRVSCLQIILIHSFCPRLMVIWLWSSSLSLSCHLSINMILKASMSWREFVDSISKKDSNHLVEETPLILHSI